MYNNLIVRISKTLCNNDFDIAKKLISAWAYYKSSKGIYESTKIPIPVQEFLDLIKSFGYKHNYDADSIKLLAECNAIDSIDMILPGFNINNIFGGILDIDVDYDSYERKYTVWTSDERLKALAKKILNRIYDNYVLFTKLTMTETKNLRVKLCDDINISDGVITINAVIGFGEEHWDNVSFIRDNFILPLRYGLNNTIFGDVDSNMVIYCDVPDEFLKDPDYNYTLLKVNM